MPLNEQNALLKLIGIGIVLVFFLAVIFGVIYWVRSTILSQFNLFTKGAPIGF